MLRHGQVVVLCVLALLTLGVVMVNSAGMSVDPAQAVTVESILLSRSTVYMALAVLAMGACAMLPIRRILPASWLTSAGNTPLDTSPDGLLVSGEFVKRFLRTLIALWPMWILVGLLLGVLATVYLPGIGRTVNGSSRWISLPAPGLESVQPSELAKWAMVGLLAWYGAAALHRMHKFWRGLLPGLAVGGVLAGFIVIEDLGTGVLMGCVACVMLIAAGARVWQIALLAPAPLTLVALAIASSDYRRDRLLAFLDPYADPDGIGYHMIQSMVAVANGEVAGRGLGHGLQKFGYLPEDRTDFLFAIICEELGVAGALVVVALYGGMLWSCWTIIRREQASMLKLLGLGVVATVGIQALINLAVVTGLGPTKGIALPLLSSGGTGWILTAASLGLIVAMDRTQDGWLPTRSAFVPVAPIVIDESPEVADEAAELLAEAPVVDIEVDHARWAPPGLFAAMQSPVETTCSRSSELVETPSEIDAETLDSADLIDGQDSQGLLFVDDVCDEGDIEGDELSVDEDELTEVMDTAIDPSDPDLSITDATNELPVEGTVEQLVIAMDEQPIEELSAVVESTQTIESSINRHV